MSKKQDGKIVWLKPELYERLSLAKGEQSFGQYIENLLSEMQPSDKINLAIEELLLRTKPLFNSHDDYLSTIELLRVILHSVYRKQHKITSVREKFIEILGEMGND